MEPRLNILVFSSIFPNSQEPNKGIYIFRQTKALSKRCNVTVVAPVPYFPRWLRSKSFSIYTRIPVKEDIDDLEVLHPRVIVPPKFGRSFYGLFYAAALILVLLKLRNRFRPDVIVSYWVYPDGFAAVMTSRLFRVPVIVGGRGCDVNSANESFSREFLTRWTLKGCARVMAVSGAMKTRMVTLEVPAGKIRVIPNGVTCGFQVMDKSGARRLSGFESNGNVRTILYCGRLSPEKGLEYLLDAAKILKDRGFPYRWLLAGDGPQMDELLLRARVLSLQEQVQFLGEVPSRDIPTLMNAADIFCLSSIREGWPNVVMEAMACGVPVVATNVGGVPEIVRSEDFGILVPPKDPVRMAEALMFAARKDWNRAEISDAVRRRSWDAVAEEILTEVRGILC